MQSDAVWITEKKRNMINVSTPSKSRLGPLQKLQPMKENKQRFRVAQWVLISPISLLRDAT